MHVNTVGANLLRILNEASASAPIPVAKLFRRLAQHCHAVMYNFCAAWMLHGRLLDPHSEFFVSRRDSNYLQTRTGLSGFSSVEEHEWHSAFTLQLEALPMSYLPLSLASQILFVGKAVRTLSSGPPHKAVNKASTTGEETENMQGKRGNGLTLKEVAGFAEEFDRLKLAPAFHLNGLEALVRRMQTVVAQRLWHLVVVEARLVDHLQAVRDLVLLGRGELWHEFIVSGRSLMQQAPTTRSEDTLRDGPFALAKQSCGLDDDGGGGGSPGSPCSSGRNISRVCASRLRLSLDLDSFACRSFDSLVSCADIHHFFS